MSELNAHTHCIKWWHFSIERVFNEISKMNLIRSVYTKWRLWRNVHQASIAGINATGLIYIQEHTECVQNPSAAFKKKETKNASNSVALTDYRSQIVHLRRLFGFYLFHLFEQMTTGDRELTMNQKVCMKYHKTHLHLLNTIPIVPQPRATRKPITT